MVAKISDLICIKQFTKILSKLIVNVLSFTLQKERTKERLVSLETHPAFRAKRGARVLARPLHFVFQKNFYFFNTP